MDFADDFARSIGAKGRRAEWGPNGFIEAWSQFVQQTRDGYIGGIYEYEAELSVRDDIAVAEASTGITSRSEWVHLAHRLANTDRLMRSTLASGPVTHPGAAWWRERLPGFAGSELAADAARIFNVRIMVRK